ncbi:MAG: TonB-dependent receptor [Endozoicomonas sp.]|uniref:TonB-dependent receptor n=1 Tax=Endozoicomonas sp. TaxID=1892382 RepID=UPI003D9B5474
MEIPRKTLLATAITAVMTGYSFPALAEDSSQEVEKIEKITVTGSRIARIDVEGATPITVISREDIEDSGLMTVADVLQSTSYNSLGSYSAQGNNSWGSQATINLRGLGAQNTLVLIDGRRVPWSGVMYGGIVDVNSIPAAAVERIEIMPDGASAIYGSDAVAGVVNIIMKKDFDGLQLSVGGSRPDGEGGDEDSFSLLWGGSNDKGNMLISYEHDESGNIVSADRDYTKATGLNSEFINDAYGVSTFGRNTYQNGGGSYQPIAGSCQNKTNFYGPFKQKDSINTYCAYDYTAEADLTPEMKRDMVNILGSYDLGNSIEFSGGISFGLRNTANTAAPVPVQFTMDSSKPGGAKFFQDNGFDPNNLNLKAEDRGSATVRYRFDVLGNRVYEIEGVDLSGHMGLKGSLELNFVDDFEWNINYMQSKSTYTSNGTNMVNTVKLEELANEKEDFFQTNGDINSKYINEIRHTWVTDVDVDSKTASGGFGFSAGELPGGQISYYLGAQYVSYKLENKFDPLSDSGDIAGVFGGTYSGDRTIKAGFAEALLPVTDQVEVNLALRQDRYSDFGNTTNPKVAIRYTPFDNLMLRGSYGTSFKAPDFSDLFTPASTGYSEVYDYKTCQANGISDTACPETIYEAAITSKGNKDLKPEETSTLMLGAVYEPIEDLTLRLDLYQIKTEDLIQQVDEDFLLREEAKNNSSEYVIRQNNGDIKEIITGSINISEREVRGLDASVEYDLDLQHYGQMDFSVAGSYIFDYKYADSVDKKAYDHAGLNGFPEYRANATVGYNTPNDMHRVSLSAYYIASQYEDENVSYDDNGKVLSLKKDGHISAYTTFTLNYRVNLPWDATASLGVRNLFDEEPSFEDDGKTYNAELYSIKGRTIYANYTQRF